MGIMSLLCRVRLQGFLVSRAPTPLVPTQELNFGLSWRSFQVAVLRAALSGIR